METTPRRLILYMSMSFDGFATRRDGTMDWLSGSRPNDAHRQRGVAELLGQTGLLVLGRRAAEDMAQAWPGSTSPTGKLMNALPKVVFSSTLEELDWDNTEVTSRPADQAIPELKARSGKDIVVFGGATFARALAAAGLIDEYRINVQPVMLGDGRTLLQGLPEPLALELVSSGVWTDGTVTHTYKPR